MLKSKIRETVQRVLADHDTEDQDLVDDLVDALVVEGADEVFDDEDEDDLTTLGEDG